MLEKAGYIIVGTSIVFAIAIILCAKILQKFLEEKWKFSCIASSPIYSAMIFLLFTALAGIGMVASLYEIIVLFAFLCAVLPVLLSFQKHVSYDENGVTFTTGMHCIRLHYDQLVRVYIDVNGNPSHPRIWTRSRWILVAEYKMNCYMTDIETIVIPIDQCIGVPRFIAYATSKMYTEERD